MHSNNNTRRYTRINNTQDLLGQKSNDYKSDTRIPPINPWTQPTTNQSFPPLFRSNQKSNRRRNQSDSNLIIRDNPGKNREKIIYLGRNILDLGSNLDQIDQFVCVPKFLEFNPRSYLDNISSLYRIHGGFEPVHIKLCCNIDDCGFIEQRYMELETNFLDE